MKKIIQGSTKAVNCVVKNPVFLSASFAHLTHKVQAPPAGFALWPGSFLAEVATRPHLQNEA